MAIVRIYVKFLGCTSPKKINLKRSNCVGRMGISHPSLWSSKGIESTCSAPRSVCVLWKKEWSGQDSESRLLPNSFKSPSDTKNTWPLKVPSRASFPEVSERNGNSECGFDLFRAERKLKRENPPSCKWLLFCEVWLSFNPNSLAKWNKISPTWISLRFSGIPLKSATVLGWGGVRAL